MGAAWKKLPKGKDFNKVIEMIKTVKSLELEACVTLGSITEVQAKELKKAGLDAYNHNIDTSPEFYKEIISTRNFEERLDTIKNIRKAGISVCCGGIMGMGETWDDRAKMLEVLANLILFRKVFLLTLLFLLKVLHENREPIKPFDMVRMIAVTRIIMPTTRVRLSAGRKELSPETQMLCFLAGANSIFYGDTLLTTSNNEMVEDKKLIAEFSG